jgi:hypothetical protein
MSDPQENPSGNDGKDNADNQKDEKAESENLFRVLDDLLAHTNSSRRLFLIFIACALFFGPVALVLGGVLLGHPTYGLRHLETSVNENSENMSMQGAHIQLVSQNGTIIRDMPFRGPIHPHFESSYTFLGLNIFIAISITVAGILLFVAIKEYRFFSKWNKRFIKYKSLKDKVDKELGED